MDNKALREKNNLRKRAEKILADSDPKDFPKAPDDIKTLILELQVHQAELEAQKADLLNTQEELKIAQEQLEASLRKYSDLYDFAPVGYCTTDTNGVIREINLTASRLLGTERSRALGLKLYLYVHKDDRDILFLYLRKVLEIEERHSCELRMIGPKGKVFDARMDSIRDESGWCRLAFSDITAEKQAKALRESEEQYRNLYENAPLGYQSLDVNGNFIRVNGAWLKTLGYERDEVIGKNFSEFLHPDWADHFRQNFPRFKAVGEVNGVEFVMRKKDGSDIIVSFHGKIGKNEHGDFQQTHCILHDVTEQRRLEDQIHQSKQTLQTMIDLNSESVFMMDPDGVILAANRAAASRLGKDVTRLIGANIYDLLPPDVAERRGQYVKRVVHTGRKVCFEDQRGNRCFSHIINPELDEQGRVARLSILAVDITERKQLEEMLRQKEKRYRSFVETMTEGFVVLDKDMFVAYVNDAFCRMMRYDKDEIIGNPIIYFCDNPNQIIVKEQLKKRAEGKVEPYTVEFIRKDSSRMPVRISPTPIFDSEKKFQGSSAVISDISLQKKEIDAILKEKSMLADEIQSYTYSLKVLLKNSDTEKKEIEENFVANIREMIIPYLEKLSMMCLSDNQKELVEVIRNSLNTIVSPLIHPMKNFTRMEIQVAHLIREGKTNAKIASFLGISEDTVLFHRKNIRHKLGLTNKKSNLRTYLLSIVE